MDFDARWRSLHGFKSLRRTLDEVVLKHRLGRSVGELRQYFEGVRDASSEQKAAHTLFRTDGNPK